MDNTRFTNLSVALTRAAPPTFDPRPQRVRRPLYRRVGGIHFLHLGPVTLSASCARHARLGVVAGMILAAAFVITHSLAPAHHSVLVGLQCDAGPVVVVSDEEDDPALAGCADVQRHVYGE